jgi:alpha-glucosidase (family GH31 glycosyl hydrolase)
MCRCSLDLCDLPLCLPPDEECAALSQIEGPGDDHELYTRWIQFAAFSAVFRSHDRGMSGGGCANGEHDGNAGANSPNKKSTACSTVKPWNVPTKYFEANRDAMQTRASWLPLIYNATRESSCPPPSQ